MNISDILKVRKKGEKSGFIVPLIEEQLLIDAVKENKQRRRDVFHPSELCFGIFCPRAWLICQRHPELYDKSKTTLIQQKRFDVGKVMHTYIQEKLGNAGVLFGVWECSRICNDESCVNVGFKPKDDVCKKALWVYKEPTVINEELRIYGNVDGIIINPPYKYTLEYKTINKDGFSTLVEPVYNHREQSFWYLHLLSEHNFDQWNKLCKTDGMEDVIKDLKPYMDMPYDGTVVVYHSKDTQDFREYFTPAVFSNTKEFMIPKDESLAYVIEHKKKMIKETLKHLDKGTLCERIYQCDDPSAKQAKKCVASKHCFKEG